MASADENKRGHGKTVSPLHVCGGNMDSREYRAEYVSRINRVMDYIDAHLTEETTLKELADIANFSEFHFHRVFRAMVGEPLGKYIQRLRLERAAMLLARPNMSVTEVAFESGFTSSAAFARAFKTQFGMTASEWRKAGPDRDSKMSIPDSSTDQSLSNSGKEYTVSARYILGAGQGVTGNTGNTVWTITSAGDRKMEANVEVKQFEETTVVYVRHVGPYQGNSELFGRLFGQLMTWAGPRGLMTPETKCIAIYPDDPAVTPDDKLRLMVCITAPEDTEVSGEIGKTTIPAGTYAAARFELHPHEYGEAWEAVCKGWLPESGYQPADGPAFEVYLNDPEEHPEKKHIVEICLSVKPL